MLMKHVQYIFCLFPYSIENEIIHQPEKIDVVITKPCALGKWSHTDQLNFSDQKFFDKILLQISLKLTTFPN